MVAISDSVSELRTLAKQLNASSDELNNIIENLQEQLAEARIGVAVYLDDVIFHRLDAHPFDDESGRTGQTYWTIGYDKIGNDWCIAALQRSCVADPNDPDPEGGSIVRDHQFLPLVKAPRAVRVEAAASLEQLIQVLAKKVRGYISNVDKAKQITSK